MQKLTVQALRRLAVLMGLTALSLLSALVYGAAVAEAAPTIGCTPSNAGPSGVLTVAVSGTSSLSDSLVVTASGGSYSLSLNSTPECTGTTYTDGGGSGYPTVSITGTTLVSTDFIGADTGLTFNGQAGVVNTLDLSQATGSAASVNVSGSSSLSGFGSNDTAVVGSATDAFTNVSSFVGLSAGNTAFAAGSAGGFTFTGNGSGNHLDLRPAGSGVSVAVNGDSSIDPGAVTGLTGGSDHFSGISSFDGSSSGGTTLQAGSGPLTFTGHGTTNALNLSQIGTSSSVRLTVNVSGATVNTVANDTAVAGSLTDTFSGVSSFVGSSDGFTTFDAGPTSGFTFNAGGSSGNTLDLTALGAGTSVSVPTGTVALATPSQTDAFSGISTFNGPTAGQTMFIAGSAGNQTFNGAGNGNTFVAGSGFGDTFSGSGTGNTLDLSQEATSSSAPLRVNVSGGTVGSLANDTVGLDSSTDTFSGITTFDGASTGNTTFYVGSTTGYSFSFAGAGNTLDLSSVVSGSPVVSIPSGTVMIAGGHDSFSGTTGFLGASSGDTTFQAGGGGGFTFEGFGSGNLLDLGSAGSAVSVTVNGDSLLHPGTVTGLTAGTGSDEFSGISVFDGSSSGGTTLQAGSGALTFTGFGTGNALDLAQVPSSPSAPLWVNLSGATISGVANDTAASGAVVDNFSDVSSFRGSIDGNTTFVPGSARGFTFVGAGSSGNTLDLSAAGTGLSVTVNGDSVTDPGTVAGLSPGTDSFAGIDHFTPPGLTISSGVESLTGSLPAATVGVGYSKQLTGSGGSGPYSAWSLQSGSLPPGMNLSTSGVLSGTPSSSGNYSFVVTFSDADLLPFAIPYAMAVEPRPVVTITSPAGGATVTSSPVTVTGTAGGGSGVKSVTVNGVSATISGGSWSATVPLTNGQNTLTATMTTDDGSTATASTTVSYEPPERVSLHGERFNGKAVLVKLACAASGSACAGKITVHFTETVIRDHKRHRMTVVVASKLYALGAGHTATCSATLNGEGRMLLKTHRTLPVTGNVTVVQFGHTRSEAIFRLTLKALL